VNVRNVINANLANGQMGFLKNMNVDATIKGVSDTSLTYSYINQHMAMAPNSNFNLPIPVSTGSGTKSSNGTIDYSQPLKAGKYHLHMVVYGQKDAAGQYTTTLDGKKQAYDYRWIFDRDFTITAAAAQKLNAKDVTINHNPGPNWLLIIGIIIIILALLILFFILWKRRHEKYDEDVYDVEGVLLYHKGDRVVRNLKVYKLDELSQAARAKALQAQLDAMKSEKQDDPSPAAEESDEQKTE
jgi:hypothetical protein